MSGTLVGPAASLASGTTAAGRYVLREADPADADRIADFVSGLSVQSQYFRFFTAVGRPSPGMARLLSDTSRADVLVIAAREAIIGHGMAVDARGCEVASADVAVVIADGWQGNGLGTMLLDLMVTRAAQRGITRFDFEVLPDNARMLGIINRRWPGASRRRTPDSVSMWADIGPVPAVAATAPPPVVGAAVAGAAATLPSVTLARAIRQFGYQGVIDGSRRRAA